jgi:hypothetical protein
MLHLVAPKQVFIWKLIHTFLPLGSRVVTSWQQVDNKLSGTVNHEIILPRMWNQNEI